MPDEKNPYLSQAYRLGGLNFPPSTPEAWAELARALKRHTQTPEHASRVISRFLEPGAPVDCPKPGDLVMMAKRVPADPGLDRPELPPPCPACEPYGGAHRLVERRNGVSGMERCGCARGRHLAALDATRKGEAERPMQTTIPPADFRSLAAGERHGEE